MLSHLTNKAHFGMPFHGHEKQTRGELSKLLFVSQNPLPHVCDLSNSNFYIIAIMHDKHLEEIHTVMEKKCNVPT